MALNIGTTEIQDIKLGTAQIETVMLGTVEVWSYEKLATIGSGTNANVQTIFGSTDFTRNVRKRLVISSGAVLGGSGAAALTIPSGMGGTLVIEVRGSVQGYSGAGGSGAGVAGGDAIVCNSPGVTVLVYHQLLAGGGGGGRGGTGGGGSYTENYTYREPESGWQPAGNHYQWVNERNSGGYQYTRGFWNNSDGTFLFSNGENTTSYNYSGWTYLRGTVFEAGSETSDTRYRIARQQQRTRTVNTNGGTGGVGGRGQGYGVARASGAAGAAGGTNAGTGGTGGAGGNWGVAGGTGATGSNGNRTNGVAGSSGGAAGRAVRSTHPITVTNMGGTIAGAIS